MAQFIHLALLLATIQLLVVSATHVTVPETLTQPKECGNSRFNCALRTCQHKDSCRLTVTVNDGNLTINNLTVEDNGEYVCYDAFTNENESLEITLGCPDCKNGPNTDRSKEKDNCKYYKFPSKKPHCYLIMLRNSGRGSSSVNEAASTNSPSGPPRETTTSDSSSSSSQETTQETPVVPICDEAASTNSPSGPPRETTTSDSSISSSQETTQETPVVPICDDAGIQFEKEAKSWIRALQHCRMKNYSLLQIINCTTEEAVNSLLLDKEGLQKGVWIGLERSIFGSNAPWRWISGERAVPPWKRSIVDPSNNHCGKIIRVNGSEFKWLDANCHDELPFICRGPM